MNALSARRAGVLVAVLTLLALGARLVGVGQLLPHRTEADVYIVPQAHAFRYGTEIAYERASPLGKYPHLLGRILALVPPEPIPGMPRPEPGDAAAARAYLDAHLSAAGSDYRHARQLIAILSALVVPFAYLLARRVLAPGPALLATLLVATSLLHVSFSQQARPHGALATFMTATLWASCGLQREASWRWLMAATAGACLSVACLHNGAAILPAALVAFLMRRRTPGRVGPWTLLVPVVAVALTIRVFYPFLFAEGGGFGALRAEGEVIEQGGHRIETAWFNWLGFLEIDTHLSGYDPALYAAGVAGIVGLALLALIRRRGQPPGGPQPAGIPGAGVQVAAMPAASVPASNVPIAGVPGDGVLADDVPGRGGALLVLAAFALPYTAALGLLWFTPERYLLPLLPVLAIGAAFAVQVLARLLSSGRPARASALLVLGGALVLWPSAHASWRLTVLRHRPDTLTLAARWLEEHVEREDARIVATPGLAVPLFFSRQSLSVSRAYARFWRTPWHLYQEALERETAAGLGWHFLPLVLRPEDAQGGRETLPTESAQVHEVLRRSGANYAVVMRSGYRDDPIRASLDGAGQVVARFAPSDTSGRVRGGSGFQVGEDMRGFVIGAEDWGPPIEIWRLRPIRGD